MTSRLPFTLAPMEGEPFEVWLHAYAARLALTPDQLADALDLTGRPAHGQVTAPLPAQTAAICAATGLPSSAVAGMFATCGQLPSPQIVRAWMPQRVTRFCPACLADDPRRMPAAWYLPVTFFCLQHFRALASHCPHCGRCPASLARPSQPAHCSRRDGSGGLLAAAFPPDCTDVPAARQAQEAISGFLTGIRDPGRSTDDRRQALAQLTNLTLIAFHLAAGDDPRPGRSFTPRMLDASTLTTAFTLLTGQPDDHGPGPLASLAGRIPPGTVPTAVPESWRGASPGLRTRIARARDAWLSPADRLRHATTLAAPRAPAQQPPGHPDLAVIRAARLPDQIWPDWAVRLTDDPAARHDRFRSSALIALLLPHSGMPLHQITTLVSGQLKRHITGYQLGKLTGPAALRILTDLAFTLDASDIPIGYQRRRDLAASTTLIDDTTWTTTARDAGMRASRPGHARRYLYELLTGCSLRTAPPPYQLTSADAQTRYHEFTISITTGLASALTGHARHLLESCGIDDEPLEWQPPPDWVTATTWPGADPAHTDPAPIHHALLHQHTPPARIAADLGISLDHLRRVLRHHPLPRPLRPIRRTLIPQAAPASPPSGQQPSVLYLDRPGSARNTSPGTGHSTTSPARSAARPRHSAGSPANTASPSAPAAARYSSPPARHPAATRVTCPNHSATPSPAAAHGSACAACSSSPSTPASTRPPRHSASGRASFTPSSPGSSTPAADPSSTAPPPPGRRHADPARTAASPAGPPLPRPSTRTRAPAAAVMT